MTKSHKSTGGVSIRYRTEPLLLLITTISVASYQVVRYLAIASQYLISFRSDLFKAYLRNGDAQVCGRFLYDILSEEFAVPLSC